MTRAENQEAVAREVIALENAISRLRFWNTNPAFRDFIEREAPDIGKASVLLSDLAGKLTVSEAAE